MNNAIFEQLDFWQNELEAHEKQCLKDAIDPRYIGVKSPFPSAKNVKSADTEQVALAKADTEVTSFNVQITTISEQHARANTQPLDTPENNAIKLLRRRFYMTGKASGSVKFYDSINDVENQLTMHLIPVVLKEICQLENEYNKVKELLANAVSSGLILPLSLEKMYYRPNCAPVVDVNGVYFRNFWRPSLIAPKEGDATPFVEFLKLAMGGRDAEVGYFIKWMALLVQDPLPKRKPPVAPYIFGNQQGQGKSLLAGILTQVLGESAVKTSSGPQALEDKNRVEFFSRTLFVADEAQLDKKGKSLQAFKNLITSTTTDEALKNQAVRLHEVPARIMMLSNYAPAHLERDDRRHFVVRWDTGLRGDEKDKYFNDLVTWLDNGGYSIVSYFLANYDVGEWDYAAPAMVTDAKLEVVQSHAGKWEQKFADFVAENDLWFVDQSHDFGSWTDDGFNIDQLPYILEQLGWQRLQGKDSTYRHVHSSGSKTTHRYWFCPEVTQVRQGNKRLVKYQGRVYGTVELYECARKIDIDDL
ncbi:primase-helicase family protein [Litorivicinus lipolyticus]|uniref:primase-helicase family protein n=1 Tax=Litorivicinus lipolyticus TaxID=418701 RepID=UPI003B5A78A1